MPCEILVHRIVWSLVVCLIVLAITGKLRGFGAVLRNPGCWRCWRWPPC